MCTKYHGHMHYYQQLIGCYVGNGALWPEVGGEHIAIATVVAEHICAQTWSYTTLSTSYRPIA